MDERSPMVRWARRCSEAIIITLACLAPWAFGAVEAWAELALAGGIALLAALGVIVGRGSDRVRNLFCAPSLALAGLALLALAQAVPLPAVVSGLIAPSANAAREGLSPSQPEHVIGDPRPTVPLPPRTLSLSPEESVNTAVWLVVGWVLFQGVLGLNGGQAAFRRFGIMAAGNAALMALFSLVQALTWNGKVYWFRASPIADAWRTGGPFIGHNQLAAYLNLGLGMSVGLLLTAGRDSTGPRRLGLRAGAAYTAGLAVVGIIASHSRSGFVAMLFSATILALFLRPKTLRVGLGLATTIGLTALFLVVLGGSSPYRRLATILDSESYADRLEIWTETIRTWTARPVWGSGLGSFGAAVAPSFRHDVGVLFARAENEYLDLLLEGGMVGLGLGLVGVVSIARSGLHALGAAASPRDRAMIVGGLFSLSALAIQSLADFSPHIPGVAITALVLSAHLYGLGFDARRLPEKQRAAGLRSAVVGLAIAALALGLVGHTFHLARAEACLAGSGIPLPGSATPTAIAASVPKRDVERMRVALERALRDRPDWAEGHLRLGMTHLCLYERTASEWIGGEVTDPESREGMADPLWLHALAHSGTAGDPGLYREIAKQGPVRLHLVPAARSFLEARRCCPVLALAHARLASLDFLLEGVDPSRVYAARALRLAGADGRAIALATQVAAQAGDLDLAALGWRRSLLVRATSWEAVADSASMILPPDRILDGVLPPGGRFPIWFADRLYSDPEDREVRDWFFREALRRLPSDPDVSEAERWRLEAHARAELNDHDRARDSWEKALKLGPREDEWRLEFVEWLVGQGEVEAGYRQAVIGVQLNPNHPGLRRALESTAEAIARGRPDPWKAIMPAPTK